MTSIGTQNGALMWGLWYVSRARLTLPRLALHFSCVKHSVNSGRAERASRLRKCHHLQQENTLFRWQCALPLRARPKTEDQRQLCPRSKVAFVPAWLCCWSVALPSLGFSSLLVKGGSFAEYGGWKQELNQQLRPPTFCFSGPCSESLLFH